MPQREYEWSFESPPIIKPHSLAKHRILKEYLRRYIYKIASNYLIRELKLYIVDGFAGGGIYTRQDTGEIHWGSPVIIHDTLNQIEQEINKNRKNLFKIKYKLYFTEEDPLAFEVLKKTLIARGIQSQPEKTVECFNQSFESIAENIRVALITNSASSRVIFNLDQYGWSKITMWQIQKILHTLPNSEILLTFTSDWILDYLPQQINGFKGILKTCQEKGILHDERDLQRLIEVRETPEWRRLSQAIFSEKLREIAGAKYYTPFFIKTADSHRHYWLLHYSQHEIARDEMIKVHWQEQNASYHPGGLGFDMLGYDASIDYYNVSHTQLGIDFTFNKNDRLSSIQTMANQLPRLLYTTGRTSIREILRHKGNTTPGSSDMIKESLQPLIDHKEIQAIGKHGENRRKGNAIGLDDSIMPAKQRTIFLPFKH